jgi:hypothetical protein
VRSANVVSAHKERPAGVASRLQVVKAPVKAESDDSRRVLKKAPIGSQESDALGNPRPEPAFVGSAFSFSSLGHGLTRESCRVESDTPGKVGWEWLSHVAEKGDGGEMSGVDCSGVVIYFPCPFGFNATCHLCCEGKPADASTVVKVD